MAQQDGLEIEDHKESNAQELLGRLGGPDTFEDVFQRAIELLKELRLCPCHVLEMVRVASLTLINTYATEEVKMVEEMTRLGLLTLKLVTNTLFYLGLPLKGKWERIAFAAVAFVSTRKPGIVRAEPSQKIPKNIRIWLLQTLFVDSLCDNRLLRLELLRFVAMWDTEYLNNPRLGGLTTYVFFENVLRLSVSQLLPVDRAGLLRMVKTLLKKLHTAGWLGSRIELSCEMINCLQVGEPERVFAYLVVLMGQAARRLRVMRGRKMKSLRITIEEYSAILDILSLLTATPPNRRMYELPGMCQLAGSAIAVTLRAIVRIETPVEGWAGGLFEGLLYKANVFVNSLRGALLDDLRRHHGRALTCFEAGMRRHQCVPVPLPQPLEARREVVQAKFLDSRTRRVMTCPMRLDATGEVVDHSTLVRLMLVAEADPFTGLPVRDFSFTPLLDLAEEIQAWEREAAFGGCGGGDPDGDDVPDEQQREHDQDEAQNQGQE